MDIIRPTQVIINLDIIERNIRCIRNHIDPHVKMLAVVKADAYGHGIIETAEIAVASGADFLGIATVEEGLALRNAGLTCPILIMGASLPEQSTMIVRHNLTAMVCTVEMVVALERDAAALGRTTQVHVKIDTGMGRVGLPVHEGVGFLKRLTAYTHIDVEGIFTHFPSADEEDRAFTDLQTNRFQNLLHDLKQAGLRPAIAHAANSGAVLDHPATYFDMIRPGLIIYGCYPSPTVSRRLSLLPAMTWKTRISHLKSVPAGRRLSYGRTYETPADTKIATLPVGYNDGYRRDLSNRGVVLVHGQRAPVVGRVCMDQCLVDVGHIPDVVIGDEVVLLGQQGGEEITVDQMAHQLGTIPHEIVCMVGNRVPQVFVKNRTITHVKTGQ